MSVRLKRHQPSTETPTRRDFLALQDSIQLALDQIDSQTIGRNDIETWSIGGDQVQPGIIGEDHLEPFLLSACKYEVASDQSIGSDVPITFATRIYDGEGVVIGTKFRPTKSGVYRVNSVIRIENDGTGTVKPGQTARIVIYDSTAAGQVLWGRACVCITDQVGDAINATIDETFEAIADHDYQLMYELPTGVKNDGTHGGFAYMSMGTGKVRSKQTLASTQNAFVVPGGFVEFEPIAQE